MIQSLQSQTTFGRASVKFRNKNLKHPTVDNSKDIKALRNLFKKNPVMNNLLNKFSDSIKITAQVISSREGCFRIDVKKGKKGKTGFRCTVAPKNLLLKDKNFFTYFKNALNDINGNAKTGN